jgi:hypothetical protein
MLVLREAVALGGVVGGAVLAGAVVVAVVVESVATGAGFGGAITVPVADALAVPLLLARVGEGV